MARVIINSAPTQTIASRTQSATNTEGVKESVEDIVGLIAPYETPFYSAIDKVTARDVIHYWQEDDLAVPSRAGRIQGWEPATASGADYEGSSPGMKLNYVQLFARTARVTGTIQNVELYGRGNELDYQIMKRGRELRRDIEATMLGDVAGVAPTTTGVAAGWPFVPTGTVGLMATAARLIDSGNQLVGGGAGAISGTAGSAAGLTVVSGDTRALTEALVLAAQKTATDDGGYPNWLLVSPYHATVVANFAYTDPTTVNNARTSEIAGTDERRVLINVVDVYKSPYGTLTVVKDLFVQGYVSGDTADEGIAYLMEIDKWACGSVREMQTEPLAKTGDNEKAMVLAECTLINRHTKASAAIRDLDTTP